MFKKKLYKIKRIVKKIESYEWEYSQMTDTDLQNKTTEFKERISKGESLDSILPEAFATCREAAWRTLHMKHFHVQLIGGVALHKGMIAEMKTGEGKTLVATTAVYLNALTGKGVHVVTVNDYLAKRDMEQMQKVYNFLGLTVGCILQDMDVSEKKAAYNADITYGTNNEFGFDYLRDNMAMSKDKVNQRELNFAIIDEVDSILIDEARTPLIISSQGETDMEMFESVDRFVKSLTQGEPPEEKTKLANMVDDINETEAEENGDFYADKKQHSVMLTQNGVIKAEQFFHINNLSDPSHITLSGYIQQSLKANYLMEKDKDYLVKDGKIAIVDDFTGRLMENRRYSDGLHQAIEAKEGVEINRESRTQATITLQNYFRMYNKIAGMTGTAKTEEHEFKNIYKLRVLEIPTNKPVLRKDLPDRIFMSMDEKYSSVANKTEELNKRGQPVLIGTESVEKSERLSKILNEKGIKHTVLNAKYHEQEAMIISQAGRLYSVTIATNMAGRGTDILLGGNPVYVARQEMKEMGYNDDIIETACGYSHIDLPELVEARNVYHGLLSKKEKEVKAEKEKVIALGGLYIIGTDKHESRRIDNQLRGRAGRQGDPGVSCFYISLEDDIPRLFGGEKVKNALQKSGIMDINRKALSRMVESSQKKIENQNFEARKATLEYDDVNNIQRKELYRLRREILFASTLDDIIDKTVMDAAHILSLKFHGNDEGLEVFLENYSNSDQPKRFEGKAKENMLYSFFKEECRKKEEELEKLSHGTAPNILRKIMLSVVDKAWVDYITTSITLKDYSTSAAYGSFKPIELYKMQALSMFDELVDNITLDIVRCIINVETTPGQPSKEEIKMECENEIFKNGIPRPRPHIPSNPALDRRNAFLERQKA